MNHEVIEVLRQRFDAQDLHIQSHPEFQREYQKIEACFERLKQTLNSEEKQLLMEWDELSTFLQAREKEKLFFQGMLEGIQLSTSVYSSGLTPPPQN